MMIANTTLEPLEDSRGGQETLRENLRERRARRVASYPAGFQRAVNDLAAASLAVEDLADSFPGLLFALATGFGTPERRVASLAVVQSGESLRAAAEVLGLPQWLRKLPAAAYCGHLAAFPADAQFGLRMASLVPSTGVMADAWLTAVSEAMIGHGPEYALWMARYGHAVSRHLSPPHRRLMAAWSWYSLHPECDAAHLIRKRWSPDMSPRRALEEFHAWRERLALADWLGSGRLEPWIAGATIHGFDFEPLHTAAEFIAAGHALDNCLDQYAAQLRQAASMVAVVRKAGRIVACVEIGLNEAETTMPAIIQLRGPKNRRANPDVWQAAFAWLGTAPIEPFAADRLTPSASDRARARRDLWKPYFDMLDASPGNAQFATEYKQQIRRAVATKATGRMVSLRTSRPRRSPLQAARFAVVSAMMNGRSR
jgi:PcfJ-like protein